ncbi:hypothetical protein C8J57DRAFT_994462, partial [Mycena rebaudengoi]
QLVAKICAALQNIYWSGIIRGFEYPEEIIGLSLYASRDWFTDVQETQMLDLLRSDMLTSGRALQDEIGEIWMMEFIKAAWRERADYVDPVAKPKHFNRARTLGEALASGEREQLGMMGNLQNRHWIAVVVDAKAGSILYGDPFKFPPDEETRSALKWWTTYHTGHNFTWGDLEVPDQKDGFNCGILSFNGLGRHFLPDRYPLIDGNGSGPADARLEMMLRIINRHLD